MTSPADRPPPPQRLVVVPAKTEARHLIARFAFTAVAILALLVGLAGSLGGFVVLVLLLAVGGFVLKDSIAAAMQWQRPELLLPSPTLELGAELTVQYRRRSRKVRDVPRCSVVCELVCEELATYQQGTTSQTERAEVFRRGFVGEGHGTAEGLVAPIPIVVPTEAGAPTMSLLNNEILWQLSARVDGPGLPTQTHRFELVVAPTLARAKEIESGVPDS